jgi:hypothetical protein
VSRTWNRHADGLSWGSSRIHFVHNRTLGSGWSTGLVVVHGKWPFGTKPPRLKVVHGNGTSSLWERSAYVCSPRESEAKVRSPLISP